ncbi:MAG: C-terminal target protein [Bacteroidota bacterium]|nr:C-terminal target protein [Bacteroidota bacterium]
MKKIVPFVCLLFVFAVSQAQVDRHPLIQSPDEHSAVIAWNTASTAIGKVKWGTSSSALNDSISESATTKVHAIIITGLQPNTKYYYSTNSSLQTSVDYFYTAKPDNVRQLDLVVYGDCGFNNSQQDAISALMANQNHDFGLVVGDVDQFSGNNYDVNYFQHYTNILKHTCHFTAIGNHDVITNNTNYTDAFVLPHNNPANSELYYSFTWGNAKFIALDGNISYTAGSAQYIWLQNELKCNDREWVFVYFHQPPWTNDWDPSYYIPFTPFYMYQGNTDMRTSIVPLFEQYHVDFVLNGHAHDYQRGVYNGVHYFITGGGGTSGPDTHTYAGSPNISMEQAINNFMKFSINGDAVHYNTYDLNGNIVDSLTLTKSFTPYNASVATVNVACNGSSSGSAVITVNGPRPPYTFSWSSGSNTDSAVHLTAGTYNVTITDTSGCIKTDSAVIQQTNPVTLNGTITDASCSGVSDGSIILTISGGTPQYVPSWNGANPSALAAGSYNVTVTDASNCSVSQTFTVLNAGGNTGPALNTAGNDSMICAGDSLSISAAAGFTNYTWNTGSHASSIFANAAGAYYVVATDSFGCLVNSDTLNLVTGSVPHLQIASNLAQLTVSLTASQSGLSSYVWNMGNGTIITDSSSHLTYTYPVSGTYTVQLITLHNCGADTTNTIITVTATTTGILNSEVGISISISPNPFNDAAIVSIMETSDKQYQARLYSVDGKLIRDMGNTANRSLIIYKDNLQAGVYLLQLSNSTAKATFRLIVE